MLCITILGCASIAEPSKPSNLLKSWKPIKLATDETYGYYHENLESNLILITMTPERYALLTERQSVPIRGEIPPRYSDFLNKIKDKYGLKRVANWPLSEIKVFCVVFEIQDTKDRESIVTALEKEPGIQTAQIVQTFKVQARTYNDPYLHLQHGFKSVQANNSHTWSRGKGVKVAVIDTGMDNTHPDLKINSESTKNFVENNDERFRSDIHGTAVGGVIAANANNNTGIVGIAPEATLLALKACWHSKQNDNKGFCNSLTLAKALNYSIHMKVNIINLSLTGPPDPILERLVLKALAQGIHVIGAIPAQQGKAFPVSIEGTISAAMPSQKSKSLSAPGRRIISTLPNKKYDFYDGSSFSTAHMSGIAALLLSLSPSLTTSELHDILKRTANPQTGEVNACRAIEVVRRMNGSKPNDKNCQ